MSMIGIHSQAQREERMPQMQAEVTTKEKEEEELDAPGPAVPLHLG
jgi:hypothetical protein